MGHGCCAVSSRIGDFRRTPRTTCLSVCPLYHPLIHGHFMFFPDQSHINRIREALWQRAGCASVMVGAGFSRNAKKVGPDTRALPLWNEVAKFLCDRLYPSGDSERLKHALVEASGTSGFLRLAQEYEAAFGRGALHRLIQELVPDDDYVPDDIHARLLRLPWRDVFTTNWDTLLERTRPLVADRAYSVMRTPEEIPTATRPRIVKLHGSFPAHIPFIFTEEDYRTYPKRFAPFLNTVQQAMMETVFCLIGFSGEDPNFLHWSGWVRDNLGESAPKIYLAGWLDLSPHRRRMLEDRNVVPIDLAHHPQAASWPEHQRHRYATEWILHTLERGRPYDVTEWPSLPDWGHSTVPEYLQPVEYVTINAPVEEPNPPVGSAEPADLEQVRAVIRAWAHNRNAYPGWLFIPPSKHFLFSRSTPEWERAILRVISELAPHERLAVLRELVWRRENMLEPLSEKVVAVAMATLDGIDCQARKIGGIEEHPMRWVDLREAWRYLAMALLTAARQNFDREAFDLRLAALLPFMGDHPDVAQRVHQEKCLWALYASDFAALDGLLKEWRPEGSDPVWMMRKAAILVETDRLDDAVRLLNRSLLLVREAPRGNFTVATPSREGWILWLALAFERGFSHSTDEVMEVPSAFRRWQQLAALECDAFAQKRDFLSALQDNPEKQDGPLFELGARRGKAIHFSNAEYERWIAARRAVRLSEVAGLPPSASHMVVASDMLAIAADHLVTADYALASRLVLRFAKSENDATLNRVFARPRIATVPLKEIDALVELTTNSITYVLPRVVSASARANFWITRLRIAMETLSRLVLRLSAARAEAIFKQALSYYRMEGVAQNRWLQTPVDHLLSRSWEALPKSYRTGLIFDVLSAPIVGLDGLEIADRFYPDPGSLLSSVEDIAPPRAQETEGRWSEIVQLIVRGLRTGGEARRRAASRLILLVLWGRLAENEISLVAQALWKGDHTMPNTLPGEVMLYDWTFMLLPEPEPGLAERLFRRKWLGSQAPKDEKDFNDFLWQLGNAFVSLRNHQRPLVLTDVERTNIEAIVETWVQFPVCSDDNPWVESNTDEGVWGLQFILPEISLSPSVAKALLSKAVALNHTKAPGFRLFAGLAKAMPDQLDEIVMSMRMGLSSDNMAVAEEAILGLHTWLKVSSGKGSEVPVPADDLLREIGVIIATRRKGALNRALQVARWVFSYGSKEQRDLIGQTTLYGLRYLIEELRYDRDHGEDSDVEIPLLRWGCAHLALAMSGAGYKADPTVITWAEVTRDDPLPEVRHAEGPISATPASDT